MSDHAASSHDLAQREARGPGLAATGSRRLALWFLALAVLVLVVLASMAIGSRTIALGDVIDALLAYRDTDDHAIVVSLRLPRTLLGIVVGMALGTAGALIQALTRNPLADPGILGVNAGAAFFVVIAVGVFGITAIWGYVWFAFFGAVAATLLVYAIGSTGRGGATPVRLTLAGVAVGAVLNGIASALALLDADTFDRMRQWGAGSLVATGFDSLFAITPFIALGLVLAFAAARPLNAIALGDDLAQAMGAEVLRTRMLVIISTTLLAGAATAAVGPIGFVGLMVPHVARWIVGPDQRWIIAFALVLSPILLLVSDIIGRLVLPPGELQVGIVTAFIGAPIFILLARRRRISGL